MNSFHPSHQNKFKTALIKFITAAFVLCSCTSTSVNPVTPIVRVVGISINGAIAHVGEGSSCWVLLSLDHASTVDCSIQVNLGGSAIYGIQYTVDRAISNGSINVGIAKKD